MKSFKISLEIRAFVAYSQKLEIKVEIIIYDYEFQNIDQVLKMLELVKNRKYIQQPIEIIKDNLMGMTLVVLELYDSNLDLVLQDNQLNFKQICALAYQLLSGLAGLQESSIIHADIKSEYILYSESKNPFLISGFLYNFFQNEVDSGQIRKIENLKYLSPKVCEQVRPYTFKRLDLNEWIFLKQEQLFDLIPSLKQSENYEFVKEIISNMVAVQPYERIDVHSLLNTLSYLIIDESSLTQFKLRGKNKQNINLSQQYSSIFKNLPEDFKQQCKKYDLNEDEVKEYIVFLQGIGYQFINILAKGNYGFVIKASFKNEQIAIKIIEPKFGKDAIQLKIEYDLLTNIKNCQHILQISNFLDVKLTNRTLFIFSELCQGNLTTLIEQKITKKQIISIMIQLLLGLQELKQINVLHIDLKPENILYDTSQNGKKFFIKIADFGQSKQLQNKEYTYNLTRVGTPKYTSEVIFEFDEDDDSSKISYKSDIYSLGIVFIELMFGRRFNYQTEIRPLRRGNLDILNLRQKTQNRDFDQIDDFLIEIVIKNMIQQKPESRKSSDELLNVIQKFCTQNFNEKIK